MSNMVSSSPTQLAVGSFYLMINYIDGPHEIYLLILNSGKNHTVARFESDELSLPVTHPSNAIFEIWQTETEKVERVLANEYGIPLCILRPFFFAENRDAKSGVGQRDRLVVELFEDNI